MKIVRFVSAAILISLGLVGWFTWQGQSLEQLSPQFTQEEVFVSLGKGFQPIWQVLSVHDGDTIRVRLGNRVERIRMACLDAPELVQPLGEQSRDNLKSLIQRSGNRVTLKVVDTDRYGRKVAAVFAGRKFLQAEQIRSGMAYVYRKYLNDCPDAQAVERAEAIAQQHRAGVWSGNYLKPWDYRKTQR